VKFCPLLSRTSVSPKSGRAEPGRVEFSLKMVTAEEGRGVKVKNASAAKLFSISDWPTGEKEGGTRHGPPGLKRGVFTSEGGGWPIEGVSNGPGEKKEKIREERGFSFFERENSLEKI